MARLAALSCAALAALSPLTADLGAATGAGPFVLSAAGRVDTTDDVSTVINDKVVIDAKGDAFAVWQEWYVQSNYAFSWGRALNRSTGLGPAQNMSSAAANMTWYADVAMDPGGNATVIAEADAGGDYAVRRCGPGSACGNSTFFTGPGGSGVLFSGGIVGADASGGAMAVWPGRGASNDHIYATRYTPGGGWSAPVQIDANGYNSEYAALSVAADGNATAVWLRSGMFGGYTVWANEYAVGAGWGTPVQVGGARSAWNLRVVRDLGGNSTVVWRVNDAPNGTTVYAAHRDKGGSWGAEGPIEGVGTQDSYIPSLAADGVGNHFAVWIKGNELWSNRYAAGVGWEGALRLSAQGTYYNGAGSESVAAAPSGEAVATWGMYNNTSRALAVRVYRPGSGWGPTSFLGNSTSYYLSGTSVALNQNLQGALLWTQGNTSDWDLYMATFELSSVAITIDTPTEGSVLSTAAVHVTGRSTVGANVTVNGVVVATDDAGDFAFVLPLLVGDNTIVATATDGLGATASASVTVRFDDPVPGLQAELNATRAAIDNLSGELNATRAELSDALDALNATLAELNGTQSDLAAAQAQVDALQADIADLQGQLDTANAAVSNVSQRLDAVSADLTATVAELNATQGALAASNATIALLVQQVADANADIDRLHLDLDARAEADRQILDDLNATRAALRDARAQQNATDARLAASEDQLAALRAAQAGMTLLILVVAASIVGTLVALHLRQERRIRDLLETRGERGRR